jgi:hypothetical protein
MPTNKDVNKPSKSETGERVMQKHEEVKKETLPTVADAPRLDGFAGYTGETEGEEQSSLVIVGEKISFTNDAQWVNSAGNELPPGLELIVDKILRVINYWEEDDDGRSRPNKEKSRILAPGEKFPNTKLLNEQEPKSKWREAFGQMRGPWENQHVVQMLDLKMNEYSYPTSTNGGHKAVNNLARKTNRMRNYYKAPVVPVVTLGQVWMPTQFGGRQAPDLDVQRFILWGDDGITALPSPDQPKLQGPQEVKVPSAKQELDDDLPF